MRSAVAKGCRNSTVPRNKVMTKFVQAIGGDTRLHILGNHIQNLSSQFSGFTHAVKLGGRMQLNALLRKSFFSCVNHFVLKLS